MDCSVLDEKDFIETRGAKEPRVLWTFLLLALLVLVGVWGFHSWTQHKMRAALSGSPFHRVTNREISLFLWQHPNFMRAHQQSKLAYLPGFDYRHRVGIRLGEAEQLAQVPPDVLFRYHHWHRLMGNHVSWRSASAQEVQEFLGACPEFLPRYWKKAPKAYVALVKKLEKMKPKEWEQMSDLQLPLEVQQAFIGWKNYFKEGELINQASFTHRELAQFLQKFPHYQRHYWKNILTEEQPNYLAGIDVNSQSQELVSSEQIAGFLKAALYNERQARLGN